jgi:cytoskeletal protein RodZ
MLSGFSKKKIKTELTLGDLFRDERKRKEITLEAAEVGTKVRINFLGALESGNWQNLPADVYVRGFVLAYAKFLELDTTTALQLFDIERKINRQDHQPALSYRNNMKEVKLLITPKLVGYFAMIVGIVSMFGYIYYQLENFAGSPSLKVSSPGNNIVYEEDTIEVRGITDSDTVLKINEENIPVTDDGRFVSNLKLHQGVNVLIVKATNRAKKETSETMTIEYKPKTAAAVSPAANQ